MKKIHVTLVVLILIFFPLTTQSQNAGSTPLTKPVMSSGLKRDIAKTKTDKASATGAPVSFGKTKTGLPSMNLGSYVELDESLKDEPYEGTIEYPDAELTEILGAISKLANKNFILDNSLKGKRITIMSPQKVTKEEAYNVFLTSLFMNGLTLVSSGKYLRVISSRDAPKSNVRVFYGDYVPPSDEIVTLVFPLKNISSEDMPRIFQDLLPRTGSILVYPETNSVIMTDSGLNLRRMISILKSVDVPGSQPKLELIPLNYASAEDLAKMIDDILDAQSGRGRTSTAASRLQKDRKIQGGGVITKIVPDKRTNSLVVLANGKGAEQLRSLVQKLDSPNATNSGNIHVYFVKNAVAEDVANTLNSLFGNGSGSTSSQPPRSVPTSGSSAAPQPVVQQPVHTFNAAGGEGVSVEGQIKLVPDKATNSLIIRCSSSNFTALTKILDKIDIPRRQVNIEATIMEINEEKVNAFGMASNVAMTGLPSAGGFIPGTAGLSQATLAQALQGGVGSLNGLIGGIAAGGSVGIGNGQYIKTFIALFQAIESFNLGQILEQPNILTTDNETGDVSVKQRKAVVTSSSTVPVGATSGNNLPVTNYGKEDIILELKVTPQIGEDNELVKLKVEQTLTDFLTSQLPGQIDTTERKATTVVTVRDGDMVAVGGLQKNTVTSQHSHIPILGDLPIIGTLFKGTNEDVVKNNLILFLHPKIIRDNRDLIYFTQERLEQRKRLSDQANDPKDFNRKEMNFYRRDVDARLQGKEGWGFRQKEATSAYLQDENPPSELNALPVDQPPVDGNETPVAPLQAPNAPTPKSTRNDSQGVENDVDAVTPRGGEKLNGGSNITTPEAPSMSNNYNEQALPPPPDDEPFGGPFGGGGDDEGLDSLNVR